MTTEIGDVFIIILTPVLFGQCPAGGIRLTGIDDKSLVNSCSPEKRSKNHAIAVGEGEIDRPLLIFQHHVRSNHVAFFNVSAGSESSPLSALSCDGFIFRAIFYV